MSTLTLPQLEQPAQTQATAHLAKNLQSLAATQPSILSQIEASLAAPHWLYARDNSLSARINGHWAAGCSVPLAAARALLKTLDPKGPVACLLAPDHLAQAAVCLERLNPEQALIVILPDPQVLQIGLGAYDFSTHLSAHRLWFVVGPDWPDQLATLFTQNPGLSTPYQFIRTALLEESAAVSLIKTSQEIFAQTIEIRSRQAIQIRERWRPTAGQHAVMAGARFRLWEDDGHTLMQTLAAAHPNVIQIDVDTPTQASALHLATAVQTCEILYTARLGRTDLPDVLSPNLKIHTWVTHPRIPAYKSDCNNDRLLLADPGWQTLAIAAGWNPDQLDVAGWPLQKFEKSRDKSLSIIANLKPLEPPEDFEYSSHRLLWEAIHDELTHSPFALGNDITSYLQSKMKKLEIGAEGLDTPLFIDTLIVSAYAQGLARTFIEANIPLKIFGTGWEQDATLSRHFCGLIENRHDLSNVLSNAVGLIHVWPMKGAHAIEGAGQSLVRPFGKQKGSVLAEARGILAGVTKNAERPRDLSHALGVA